MYTSGGTAFIQTIRTIIGGTLKMSVNRFRDIVMTVGRSRNIEMDPVVDWNENP